MFWKLRASQPLWQTEAKISRPSLQDSPASKLHHLSHPSQNIHLRVDMLLGIRFINYLQEIQILTLCFISWTSCKRFCCVKPWTLNPWLYMYGGIPICACCCCIWWSILLKPMLGMFATKINFRIVKWNSAVFKPNLLTWLHVCIYQ